MVEVLEASNKAFLEKGGKWWKISTVPRRSLLKALNIIKVFLLMTGKKQFLKKSTQESFLRRRKKRVNTRLLLLKNMFSTFYVDGKYYNLMIYLLRGKASFFFGWSPFLSLDFTAHEKVFLSSSYNSAIFTNELKMSLFFTPPTYLLYSTI